MTDLARLEAAADRQEITDLIYRYCRAMDRMDHEQGYAIWHEDGTADYGPDVFQGTGQGLHRLGLRKPQAPRCPFAPDLQYRHRTGRRPGGQRGLCHRQLARDTATASTCR